MNNRRAQGCVLAGLVLALAACSNAQTVQESATDAGSQRSFDAPYDEVKLAAKDALIQMKLVPTLEREEADGYVLVIARAPHGFSWGEVGRVTVVKADQPPVTVYALYEKRLNVPFHTSDGFGRNVFTRMEAFLSNRVATGAAQGSQ